MSLGRNHAKISRTLATHVDVFRSLAASQQAFIVVSLSDFCVPPARERAPASAASLWASRHLSPMGLGDGDECLGYLAAHATCLYYIPVREYIKPRLGGADWQVRCLTASQ
jgi:hypothetical protein